MAFPAPSRSANQAGARSAPVRAENRNSSLIVPHLVPSYPVICGQADPHAVKVKQRAGGVSPLIIDVETEPDPLVGKPGQATAQPRSEEHTSELQSLMRNSYAVFCLK